MIEAALVLAIYLAYEFTPKRWRSNINWYFWALAFGGALIFGTYSLIKTGVLPEPATGLFALPVHVSWLQ